MEIITPIAETGNQIGNGRAKLGKKYREFYYFHQNVVPILNLTVSVLSVSAFDIGCATGFTLESAEENEWEAIGIELTPASIDFARKRGLKIIDKPLEEIEFDEKFAAISLFDVLEHLSNPREILDKVHESLFDG